MPKQAWSQSSFTIESPDAPAIQGEGRPRRAAYLAGKDLTGMPPGINNLHENLLHGAKISPNRPYLGHRARTADGKVGDYVWQTYAQVVERVKRLGNGLAHRGLNARDPLGLFSVNRAEWVLGEQAAYLYNFMTVPLYDTLGAEAIEYIVNQTRMRACIATKDKAKALVDIKAKLPTLELVVIMDGLSFDDSADVALVDKAKASGLHMMSFANLESEGQAKEVRAVEQPAVPNDVATVCYTSGTTGLPKGVILTHRNILAASYAVQTAALNDRFTRLSSDDVHISYLPLAHVFERIIQQFVVMHGASIGFYQGDTAKLLDDVAVLRPTVFVSVPRLFNRIFDKVSAGVKAKGGVAEYLFRTAYQQKLAGLKRGTVTHWLWDKLVFANVRAKLGGRVKFLFTGSAPISGEVMDFLKVCFSCDVYEGYGQTETAAGISITVSGDYSSGHIGVPLSCNEVKLVDVPSMNYFSTDKPQPRGEICVRGAQVFKGYYLQDDKTRETLDENGWCHTGDVGTWDSLGRLVIIDRVKNIFKLAQGEYIAPEKIENVYTKHELVAQAFVYGDSLQSVLVAIIVPDHETVIPWARKLLNTDDITSVEQLVGNAEATKKILQSIQAYGKANGLKGFENVKAIALEAEPFSVENNLFTPTFKLKRHDAKVKYQATLDALYAQVNSA
ncbi:medium-chain fatty acid-CoA ligase faa2 [Sorochytrium milnesiophthora]